MKPTKFSVAFTILATLLAPAAIFTLFAVDGGGLFSGASPFDPEYLYLAPAVVLPYLLGNLSPGNEIFPLIGAVVIYYLAGTGISKIPLPWLKKAILLILIAYYLLMAGFVANESYKQHLYYQGLKTSAIENVERNAGKNLDDLFIAFDHKKIERLYSYTSDKAKVYELFLKGSQADDLPDLQIIIYEPVSPEAADLLTQELLTRFASNGKEAAQVSLAGNKIYQNPEFRNLYLWPSGKYIIYFNTGTDESVLKYLQKYPSDLK